MVDRTPATLSVDWTVSNVAPTVEYLMPGWSMLTFQDGVILFTPSFNLTHTLAIGQIAALNRSASISVSHALSIISRWVDAYVMDLTDTLVVNDFAFDLRIFESQTLALLQSLVMQHVRAFSDKLSLSQQAVMVLSLSSMGPTHTLNVQQSGMMYVT